jgi:hypothetical protein
MTLGCTSDIRESGGTCSARAALTDDIISGVGVGRGETVFAAANITNLTYNIPIGFQFNDELLPIVQHLDFVDSSTVPYIRARGNTQLFQRLMPALALFTHSPTAAQVAMKLGMHHEQRASPLTTANHGRKLIGRQTPTCIK